MFKKYERGRRIQATEESFEKGIRFAQTPLDTGEHKIINNYDFLNEDKVATPRKGIRTKEIALPITTPDLYSKMTQDILLTHNLDAIEEDATHYALYVANQCSESSVGLHSGPAELWVVDKDNPTTYPMLDEYGITTRDMYAIPLSYDVTSILDETITKENHDKFFEIVKLDYNADFTATGFRIDPTYKGGVCFKTGPHPFVLNVISSSSNLRLYEAYLENGMWKPKLSTEESLVQNQLKGNTYYYILNKSGQECSDNDPFLTLSTNVTGAKLSYVEETPVFESSQKTYTYHAGTCTAEVNAIGVTAKVNPKKFFSKIHTAGTHTFTYLLNTTTAETSIPSGTVTIDKQKYNRVHPTQGTVAFKYITNVQTSTTCSRAECSIELDIHRYNRQITDAGEKTYTFDGSNWKLDGNAIVLEEYGILYKDPNGTTVANDTIKIKTTAKNRWQLDDNYVNLSDHGLTVTGTPREMDVINVKSIPAGTWLYNSEYVNAYDYGIEITDVGSKLRDGETLVVTAANPTGWTLNNAYVELAQEGITFEDVNDALADSDWIRVTKTMPAFATITFGRGTHATPGSMYYIPADANGNGFTLNNSKAAKAIGVFAWDNNYYNFNSHGELIRSRYQIDDPENNLTRTYYAEALKPKSIKASEAVSAGFNMLSDAPYEFANEFAEGTVDLQGILLYDDKGNLITEPLINTPYTLRCFYTVAHNTRYKFKLSYREVNTTDWIDIEEFEKFYKNETTPEDIKSFGFKSPIENAIIRVQAFKWDKTPTASYATSVANAAITINLDEIKKQFKESGLYSFVYDGSAWTYLGKTVSLSSYGISYTDITSGLEAGSTLKITMEYKEEYQTDPEKVTSMAIKFATAPSSTTANKELKNYDLSKATGMTYWKGRIWLYGLHAEPNVLFASDVNEPTYFPYPNNVDIFDEPVLLCEPFMDNMLVFTRSKLYQLTLQTDGSWTTKIIQNDLNFTEFDMNLVKPVKNMVFFKSGDYYYMVVPKTLSLQNELAIAPVSKNIEQFLDNFVNNVKELFNIVYEYEGDINLAAHYNYLNYEDVHNVYSFETEDGLLLNLGLLYSTTSRHWRFYTVESQELYRPERQDATKSCQYYAPLHGVFRKLGVDTNCLGVQLLEADHTTIKDFYIPTGTVFVYDVDTTDAPPNWDMEPDLDDRASVGILGPPGWFRYAWLPDNRATEARFKEQHKYGNFTLLDCGYRNIITDYKKRCRELQFKFNNLEMRRVTFYTEFLLDGELRKWYYNYSIEHIIDPNDPKYGEIYIDRTPVENVEIPSADILGESSRDLNAWTLDASRFPEIAFWKARLKVSGKGYTPRFRLLSRCEESYELIGYSWVYRDMYSR